MPEEFTPDATQATTQEAQLAAESLAAGEEKAADIDVAADYEASKEFSVSQVDQGGSGAEAAAAATAPQQKMPAPDETLGKSAFGDKPDSNPDDFREMAREVNPRAKEG